MPNICAYCHIMLKYTGNEPFYPWRKGVLNAKAIKPQTTDDIGLY
jgi:hypothetical protein